MKGHRKGQTREREREREREGEGEGVPKKMTSVSR
jgi:hypothetical protein